MRKRTRLKGTLSHRQRLKFGLTEKGVCFRTQYKISRDKCAALAARIEEELKPEARERNRGPAQQKSHERLVQAIFANALYQRLLGVPVHYSRSSDNWNRQSRRLPPWIPSGGPRKQIDRWDEAKLLEQTIAVASSAATEQSEFAAADKLIAIANELGIDLGDIYEVREERPTLKIKCKNEKGENVVIAYDRTKEPYASILAEMDRYNDFIATFAIDASNNGVSFGMNCNSLFPVFNNQELTLGGRYFGAIYQQVRSEIRGFIKIDGEKTVELDLSACFGRMLYHLIGEDYVGDPYAAAEALAYLNSLGIDYYEARGILKLVFQLLVNCSSKVQAAKSLKDQIEEFGLDYNQCFIIVDKFYDYHPHIQDLFFKGIGTSLMYVESQIAREVMMKGVEQDICVLVIHDSFIVQKKHEEWLRETMLVMYYNSLSFLPVIK